MRTVIFFIVSLLISGVVNSQDYTKLEKVKLSAPSDYEKNEARVLDCAEYVLEGTVKENEMNKLYAIQFVLRWMEGTPDYTFTIGPDFVELTEGKTDLSGLYMASLVKATIDCKSEDLYLDEVNSRALDIYLNYCADPKNKAKKTKAVKKLLKEREA